MFRSACSIFSICLFLASVSCYRFVIISRASLCVCVCFFTVSLWPPARCLILSRTRSRACSHSRSNTLAHTVSPQHSHPSHSKTHNQSSHAYTLAHTLTLSPALSYDYKTQTPCERESITHMQALLHFWVIPNFRTCKLVQIHLPQLVRTPAHARSHTLTQSHNHTHEQTYTGTHSTHPSTLSLV